MNYKNFMIGKVLNNGTRTCNDNKQQLRCNNIGDSILPLVNLNFFFFFEEKILSAKSTCNITHIGIGRYACDFTSVYWRITVLKAKKTLYYNNGHYIRTDFKNLNGMMVW